MALFSSIFQKTKTQGQAPEEPSELVSRPDPQEVENDEPDLDQIRQELADIAALIGPGESYGLLTEQDQNLTTIEVGLQQLYALVPGMFKVSGVDDLPVEKKACILVEDLYDQLQNGQVTASVSQLFADVDDRYLTPEAKDQFEERVSLPLPLVVGCISPEELSKRTTKVDRDPELKNMPDVFKHPSQKAPAASTSPAESPDDVQPGSPSDPEGLGAAESESTVSFSTETPVDFEMPEKHAEDAEPVFTMDDGIEDMVLTDLFKSELDQAPPKDIHSSATEEEDEVSEFAGFEIPDSIPLSDLKQERPLEAAAESLAVSDERPAESSAEKLEEPVLQEESILQEEPICMEEPVHRDVASALPEPGPQVSPPTSAEGVNEGLPGHHLVMVRGLDLNRATVEELEARLDGVGAKMAIRIVEDRELNGAFTDEYDLARVQGIGMKLFESITGKAWREDLCGRREILANILDSSHDHIPDIRSVASHIAETRGFEGCVIAHSEGYVLASSWSHDKNEALGAFAPQMFKKVAQYIRRLEMGGMDAFTFFFETYPITLVNSGDLFIAAIHSPNRFSRRHVQIARALTAELDRRLHRLREI